MSIGEPLTQEGVLTITPLRALLYPGDSYTEKWILFIEVSIENLFGYDYGIDELETQIYDGYGQISYTHLSELSYGWPQSIRDEDGAISGIPPGFSGTGFISALIGERTSEWSEQPTGLKMLIYMPSPSGPIGAVPVYGLYDLGNPTIIKE